MILVDSNVWIDLISDDPQWRDWSLQQLKLAHLSDKLAINPVIYAEIATQYETADELDAFLKPTKVQWAELSRAACFAASKAFLSYRRKRGVRTAVLPDFLIGAHAITEGWTLLTRDAKRYRTYFPTLKLIAP
jgi:predicted nucleic acid-binding protein